MYIGMAALLEVMGAFYAQQSVVMRRQTVLTGTIVGNYYDMGTNVPQIYQVPSLPQNLPMGMIGAYPVVFYSRVSWREV